MSAAHPAASAGKVSEWAARVMKLAAELERQSQLGYRDGAARLETCVALAEAWFAMDRVVVREPVRVAPARGAGDDPEFRRMLETFAREGPP